MSLTLLRDKERSTDVAIAFNLTAEMLQSARSDDELDDIWTRYGFLGETVDDGPGQDQSVKNLCSTDHISRASRHVCTGRRKTLRFGLVC